MTLGGRSQDTNKGHIGRPVLPMSPGSGGGSTASIKWEEPRDCTWPCVSPPDASEVECISFTSCCGEHEAQTLQSFARPWDKETAATDEVAVSQPCPLGSLPADDRALEESQSRVCF